MSDLNELVDEFARNAEAEFDLADLVQSVRKTNKRCSEFEVYESASDSPFLFEVDEIDDRFIPRHLFFKGAEFRIAPTPTEIEGGFLIPGHRFMPFISPDTFPARASLKLPDGTFADKRSLKMPFQETLTYLHFFGPASSLAYLVSDSEKNTARLMPPYDKAVDITVFDLKAFFATTDFRAGDSLMVTVEDWLRGGYSVTHIKESAVKIDLARSKKWTDGMREMLEDAVDYLGVTTNCSNQLAHALFFSSTEEEIPPLMKTPPMSLAAFSNMQKDLAVKVVGENALFWDAADDPNDALLLDALENPAEPESELGAFFEELGLSLSEDDAEAYMRDALYQGGKSADDVLARVVEGRSLYFPSAKEQQHFHELWNQKWDAVKSGYVRDPADHAELRSRFLKMNDKAFATMRALDSRGAGFDIFGNPAFMEYSQLTSMISQGLALLNRPEEGSGNSSLLKSGGLDQLEAVLDELGEQLLASSNPTAKKAMKKSAPKGGMIYQVKVTLKGTKPPIWRRLLVPSSMPLDDLHEVIQIAMGWFNCHLYQFIQGRTYYQPNPEDFGFGGFEAEDTAGLTIGHLLNREKDKVVYEYDFGDSWEHTVVLEKILKPEKGAFYPVCIKGKRACPPEDCGGVWGYENLLEILADPKHPEYQEITDWAGEFDPEEFDLDEINGALKLQFD